LRAPAASSAKLTGRDIQVLPFIGEENARKYAKKDPAVPDELKVQTSGNRIHIFGKRKSRVSAHVGKVVLIPPAERTGNLSVKVPSSLDRCYYYLVLEVDGEVLQTKKIELKPKTPYEWTVKAEGGATALRVTSAGKDVMTLSASTETVKAVGFASTVRWEENDSDIEINAK